MAARFIYRVTYPGDAPIDYEFCSFTHVAQRPAFSTAWQAISCIDIATGTVVYTAYNNKNYNHFFDYSESAFCVVTIDAAGVECAQDFSTYDAARTYYSNAIKTGEYIKISFLRDNPAANGLDLLAAWKNMLF